MFYFFDVLQQIFFFFQETFKKNTFKKWNINQFMFSFFEVFFQYETSVNLLLFITNFIGDFFSILGFFNFRKINGIIKMNEFLKLIGLSSESTNKNLKIFFSPESRKFPILHEPSLQFVCLETGFFTKIFLENFNIIIFLLDNLFDLKFFGFILDFKPTIFGNIKNFFKNNLLFSVIFYKYFKKSSLIDQSIDANTQDWLKKYSGLLNRIIDNIPEGIICLFPSKNRIEKILNEWDQENYLSKITKKTKIFFESARFEENLIFIEQYKLCCDFGIKTIFFGIYGGILNETNLSVHYSKAFIFIEPELFVKKEKLNFILRNSTFLRKKKFLKRFENIFISKETNNLLNKLLKSKKNCGSFIFLCENAKFFKKKFSTKFWSSKTDIEKKQKVKTTLKNISDFYTYN